MEGTVPTCSEPRRQMFEMAAEWIHNMTHPVCSTKFHLSPPSCHKARQCIEKFGVSSMRSEKSIGEFCRYVFYFCMFVGFICMYKDIRIFWSQDSLWYVSHRYLSPAVFFVEVHVIIFVMFNDPCYPNIFFVCNDPQTPYNMILKWEFF